MVFKSQSVLPAVRKMKDFEKLMGTSVEFIVILDSHIAQLKPLVKLARASKKSVLLHADLIHGLKNDEYAAEFLCQDIHPAGIISTRANVLSVAKKKGLITVQRLFLLDSMALETSYRSLERVRPDVIEVLPGLVPNMISEIKDRTGIPVIAGGLIRSKEDVDHAFKAGASAVTTSLKSLWPFKI
ncbi:glycerol uptake operon antiterminator [Scopulibacillus darangshiensis]|uniref:Glycerol uptake operon antiterminator regulatory protein n=1 Tax=Scopulibacillus darangshiensis TaxID=442528 RepID=A0A4R2NYA1_9BACL|nr:glycerol-3-phosphate responsive antiterminator [Scopulibacillus darangshiensis]TCP26604.1 glycerol uptake operon antiterminator [Scopulibacillus darangshiensis]